MTKQQIINEIKKALQANSETDLVEFKDARGGFPKKTVRKTLSAFGNTVGGIIVFGVQEKKEDRTLEIVGDIELSKIQEDMTSLSSNEMSEVLRLEYHILDFEDKKILAVYVPECANHSKPYYFQEIGMPKGAYLRDGNTDRQITDEEMKSYVRNARVDNFDGSCANDLVKDDLSLEKVEKFLQKSAEKTGRKFNVVDDAVLQNIGVIKKCKGILRPTIAGYLMFAEGRPQDRLQFERYKIRCVRYKGSSVASDIIDKADVGGTLDEQIDMMEAFVLRNIKNSAKIVGTKRVERYEYPQEAIREIVANAVIHRDYRITETYTQVNVFEDRIEVFNPGNLPPGVTVENIKDAQESRNRIIAARLNEMDYLEEYGRGIDIVFIKMSKWNLLPPIFKNSSNSFKVILPGEKLSQLNERQVKIWEYLIINKKITKKEAVEILPEISEESVKNDIRKMKEIGLIEQKGESINIYYETKF